MAVRDLPPFHHAFPVSNLEETRRFYSGVLGCAEARRTSRRESVDFDFFGHHIVAHLVEGEDVSIHRRAAAGANLAVRHFGVVLPWQDWEALADRLRQAGATFAYEPRVRHKGEPREEALMLLFDPSGNGIEFKTFRDLNYLLGSP